MVTRYIKTVKISASDIDAIDEKINTAVRNISFCGGKIISIITKTVGLSPMDLLFIIIYESGFEITDSIISEKVGADNER